MKTIPMIPLLKQPRDFSAPCGCKVSFDNDGYIRLHWCKSHSAWDENAVRERTALVAVVACAKRYRAAEIAFNKSATLTNKQDVSNYGHDFDMAVKNLTVVTQSMKGNNDTRI